MTRRTGLTLQVSSNTMCRSFLSVWKDENGKEVLDGRNNLGVNSVSIPMVALDSSGDFDKFWEILDERCEIAHRGLQERIKTFKGVTSEVAPVLYREGAFGVNMKKGEEILPLFANGRSSLSLGFIGLAEAAYYMFNTDSVVTNKEAYKFTLAVAQFMRDKADSWKEAEGWGYSLYSLPAEGFSSRSLEKAKARHGVIKNITDKDYFTNSYHIDVREKISPFTKIELEAPFQWIASAGHICYSEFPDMKNNLSALEDVWDYAIEKMDYYSTNTGIDTCHDCDFVGEMELAGNGLYKCPKCGNNEPERMQVCRTICGYLGSIEQRPVNKGKAQEFTLRVKHS